MAKEEVKVTRKYQITIPESIRSEFGIKIGDKLVIKTDEGRIIVEAPERISDPVEYLWNLSEKPINIDAVKLVEKSLPKALPPLKKPKQTKGM